MLRKIYVTLPHLPATFPRPSRETKKSRLKSVRIFRHPGRGGPLDNLDTYGPAEGTLTARGTSDLRCQAWGRRAVPLGVGARLPGRRGASRFSAAGAKAVRV